MFRRATLADVTTVRNLTRLAYAKWVPLIGREPLPMTADFERAVTDHIIDLLITGTDVVGLVEVIPHEQYLLIENLAVDPNHQGKGLGDLLLKRAEAVARSINLDEVRLYTNAAFASNLVLYGKRGYDEFAREPIPAGGTVVHLRKKFSPHQGS